jgi:hypothetical protein
MSEYSQLLWDHLTGSQILKASIVAFCHSTVILRFGINDLEKQTAFIFCPEEGVS